TSRDPEPGGGLPSRFAGCRPAAVPVDRPSRPAARSGLAGQPREGAGPGPGRSVDPAGPADRGAACLRRSAKRAEGSPGPADPAFAGRRRSVAHLAAAVAVAVAVAVVLVVDPSA